MLRAGVCGFEINRRPREVRDFADVGAQPHDTGVRTYLRPLTNLNGVSELIRQADWNAAVPGVPIGAASQVLTRPARNSM